MFYGFVGGPIKTVYDNYRYVEQGRLIYPYARFKKFRTYAEAWNWVNSQSQKIPKNSIATTYLNSYGDTFKNNYIEMSYTLHPDCVTAKLNTKKFGNVKLISEDRSVRIINKPEKIEILIQGLRLNKNKINHHLIAISALLEVIGTLADVNIVLDNHAVLYMLSKYKGSNRALEGVLKRINDRLGNISFKVEIKELENEER